jgi:LysM repeat protein
MTIHRVRRGDTLTRIARRFDTTVAVLKELNGMKDPPRIRIGQRLRVPAPSG